MDPIKLVIIEDNVVFRQIIKEVLESESNIKICDEAGTLQQARDVLLKHSPDIAILDLSIDEWEGGFKLLREISASKSNTNVIVLSAHDEINYSAKSLSAGAKGYVCKDKTVSCLINAIHSVVAGKEFVSSDV